MSLTTYHSQFVLVGGCQLSTRDVTNTLHTSTTGREWEPSLPAMPTKRYGTSSVGIPSPEILVVAGGVKFNGDLLDVVELLFEDKWTIVDPLPAPCRNMQSTLHDRNLHFMGSGEQDTSVYTCSLSSLISSVTESSNTSTNSPLWRQYRAPNKWTTAVSYSSRLANIDDQGTIRGYCTLSQSWVEATSTGDIPRKDTANITATVLTTGDIAYCHIYRGVYKVSLSGGKTM